MSYRPSAYSAKGHQMSPESYTRPRAEALPVAAMDRFYNEQVDIDIDGDRQQRPTSHFA